MGRGQLGPLNGDTFTLLQPINIFERKPKEPKPEEAKPTEPEPTKI